MIGGALAVGLAVVSLVACGDDDEPDSTTTTTSSTTTTSLAGAGSSTTVVNEADDRLEDGVHFGYLTSLTAGHDEIVGEFDLAELLTGKAAADAQAQAGVEEPLDFYVRNVNPKLSAILVDPEAQVLDVDDDDCCEPKSTTPAKFAADREQRHEERTAVKLTVVNGTVTRIEEIYFP
jgi:hypothetical protein